MHEKLLNLLDTFSKVSRDIKSRTINKNINRELALQFGRIF